MIIDSHQHVMLPTEKQIRQLDDAGVDKAVLFSTTIHPEKTETLADFRKEIETLNRILAGGASVDDAITRARVGLGELAEIVQQHPDRFLGFGPIPLGLTAQQVSSWVETQILANALNGIGEFTPGNAMQMSALEPVLEALTDFPGLPVWVHTFHPVSRQGLQILMELCRSFPNTPVVFGHLGGVHWIELIEFAKTQHNVWLDLSATYTSLAPRLSMTELPNRCLFSSDAPYGEPALTLEMICRLSPSRQIADGVLGENFLRLLGD